MMSATGEVYNTYKSGPSTEPWGTPESGTEGKTCSPQLVRSICSKREHFSYKGLGHSLLLLTTNTGRKQARIKKGERAGEARYKLCFPKANKR